MTRKTPATAQLSMLGVVSFKVVKEWGLDLWEVLVMFSRTTPSQLLPEPR